MHQRVGQMDRRTDTGRQQRPRLRIASRGNQPYRLIPGINKNHTGVSPQTAARDGDIRQRQVRGSAPSRPAVIDKQEAADQRTNGDVDSASMTQQQLHHQQQLLLPPSLLRCHKEKADVRTAEKIYYPTSLCVRPIDPGASILTLFQSVYRPCSNSFSSLPICFSIAFIHTTSLIHVY